MQHRELGKEVFLLQDFVMRNASRIPTPVGKEETLASSKLHVVERGAKESVRFSSALKRRLPTKGAI